MNALFIAFACVLGAILVVALVAFLAHRAGVESVKWTVQLVERLQFLESRVKQHGQTIEEVGRAGVEAIEKAHDAIVRLQTHISEENKEVRQRVATLEATNAKLDTSVGALVVLLDRGRHVRATSPEDQGQPASILPRGPGGGWGGEKRRDEPTPGPPPSLTRSATKPGLEAPI